MSHNVQSKGRIKTLRTFSHHGCNTMFGVFTKLRIANSVLPHNLLINMTSEENIEEVININNEFMCNTQDDGTDHKLTIEWNCRVIILNVKYVMMGAETEVRNDTIRTRSVL